MSEIDFSRYKYYEDIVKDIKSIKIQGATNVAIATFEGLKIFLNSFKKDASFQEISSEIERVGNLLACARPNEPLAKNGLKYVTTMFKLKGNTNSKAESAIELFSRLCDEYLEIVKSSKAKIVKNSKEVLPAVHGILTHCHSSNAEHVIVSQSKRVSNFKVICTETRPLYQGRITSANLLKEGLDTTLIADSSAESFIVGKGNTDIELVFLGCDQISMNGDAINKIGSWGIALASYYASKPVYIISSILKVEPSTQYSPVTIEMREGKEIWPDAPEGLKLYNPAFELVNKEFIAGYITEVGLVKPDDIKNVIRKEFEWIY